MIKNNNNKIEEIKKVITGFRKETELNIKKNVVKLKNKIKKHTLNQ